MSKKLFVIVLPLLFLGCKENAPPQPPQYVRSIELEALDASCTEVWLKITLTQTTTDSILLTRDGQSVQTLRLTTADSILIDEGLLPNRSYLYKAYRLSGASVTDSSEAVQVTTMDTTSHNFTWQIDTLGDGGGSVLYDVAIINDTLAYAVGEIWKKDSNGNWINPPYNIAKWNGQQWELMRRLYDCRLYFPNCGPNYYLYTPIRSIFAFGPNDIWMAAGTAQHWDGVRWTEHAGILGVGDANKIWGVSSNNLYFVGNNGFIAHYDGASWRRIESGTTLPIMDVYGTRKDQSGDYEVLAVAEAYATPGGNKILSISDANVRELSTPELLSWDVWGIWFVPDRWYTVVGDGVWRAHIPEGHWTFDESLPRLFSTSIDGQGLNDIVVGGAFWLLAHWNGIHWRTYFPRTSGSFTSVALKGNTVIAVGGSGNRAIVARGTR